MGSPDGPVRARDRDAWISINATEPMHLRLLRRELRQNAAEPERVLAEAGRIQSSPAVAEYPSLKMR